MVKSIGRWKDNRSVTNCEDCGSDFKIFRRRHHCRQCGGIFCGECSRERIIIEIVKRGKGVRVCGRCAEAMKKGRESANEGTPGPGECCERVGDHGSAFRVIHPIISPATLDNLRQSSNSFKHSTPTSPCPILDVSHTSPSPMLSFPTRMLSSPDTYRQKLLKTRQSPVSEISTPSSQVLSPVSVAAPQPGTIIIS
eukprot:TRINITY_DN20288_c0_g1_i1.p1 TRINITY_DN20288_c0_g1~~TRINITY_DN20288_c0_g1_i1.p1  ORF type:complete len:196 (+),score=16.17 TRINITY_DN20288_c0_g1_i1:48-635(+)